LAVGVLLSTSSVRGTGASGLIVEDLDLLSESAKLVEVADTLAELIKGLPQYDLGTILGNLLLNTHEVVVTNGVAKQGYTLADFKAIASDLTNGATGATFRDWIQIIEINGRQINLSLTDSTGGRFQNTHTIKANDTISLAADAFGTVYEVPYFSALHQVCLPNVNAIGDDAFAGTAIQRLELLSYTGGEQSDGMTPFGNMNQLEELCAPKLFIGAGGATIISANSPSSAEGKPGFSKITIKGFAGDTPTLGSNSYIDGVQALFRDQTNLFELKLIDGCPAVLPENTFNGCERLRHVDLSNVKELKGGALVDTRNLENQTLHLHGMKGKTLTNSSIKELVLEVHEQDSDNISPYWTMMVEGAFAGSHIESLTLSSQYPLNICWAEYDSGTTVHTYHSTLSGMACLRRLHVKSVLYSAVSSDPDGTGPYHGRGSYSLITGGWFFGESAEWQPYHIDLTLEGGALNIENGGYDVATRRWRIETDVDVDPTPVYTINEKGRALIFKTVTVIGGPLTNVVAHTGNGYNVVVDSST
jgi:hypothetical protein